MRVNVPITVALDVGAPTSCVPETTATTQSETAGLLQAAVVGPLMIWGGAKGGGLLGTALAVCGAVAMYRGMRDYSEARTRAVVPPPVPAAPASPPCQCQES